MRLRYLVSSVVLLAGCYTSTVFGQCVNPSGTCGNSVTANMSMCRLPPGCKNPDYASNYENSLIDIDTKFAATTGLEGHGHRGTSGDGPKLDPSLTLLCSNSPSSGQCLSWNGSQCTWGTCGGGSGSGDVTGPASSIDRDLAVFDGTTGKIIKDVGFWNIKDNGGSQDLVTPGGSLGIGTDTPDARFESLSTDGEATKATCEGAEVGSITCTRIQADSTSSTASARNIAQRISIGGTWNGANSAGIGTYYDIDGTSVTNPYAIYINDGDFFQESNNRMGLGDSAPDATLEINNLLATTVPAFESACTGAFTASSTCNLMTNNSTSGTASVQKVAQLVTSQGTNNGSGASSVGSMYVVTGGTTNQAIRVASGDIVTVGKIANADDTTPDAHLDILTTDSTTAGLFTSTAEAGLSLNATASGVAAGGTGVAAITNLRTGGASGQIKSAAAVSSTGAHAGINTGLFVIATGGAEANYALAVPAGDIFVAGGTIATTSTGVRNNFTCDNPDSSCVRITSTNLASNDSLEVSSTGTNPFGIDVEVTGDGSGGATGFELDVTNANAQVTAFQITATGQEMQLMTLTGNGESDTASMIGSTISLDGNTTGGEVVAQKLIAQDAEKSQALEALCVQTVGDIGSPCVYILTQGDAAGDFFGQIITVDADGGTSDVDGLMVTASDGGSSNNAITATASGGTTARALIASASGATTNIAASFEAGDVIMGIPTSAEDFHWDQGDSQFILNVDSGTATSPGDSTVELHNNLGEIALDIFATGAAGASGKAINASSSGAMTATSIGSAFANVQTSSTTTIDKIGVRSISSGTWDGANANNAAFQGSASGGTNNYAFWALEGGFLGPWFQYQPHSDPPFTCAAAYEGMTAYDGVANLLCICSDSDGSNYEWEAVEDRTTTCTF